MRFVIGFLLALALAGCDRQKGETPQGGAPGNGTDAAAPAALPGGEATPHVETGVLDRSHAGTAAPKIVFKDPDGADATFASFRGKPLLVNLWATWCGPCVAEMPTLDTLAGREQAVKVLALSQDTSGKEKVDAFFAGRNFAHLEPYLDGETAVMAELKLDTLPTTILYDKDGKEVWRVTGMMNWTGDRAAKLLREAGV